MNISEKSPVPSLPHVHPTSTPDDLYPTPSLPQPHPNTSPPHWHPIPTPGPLQLFRSLNEVGTWAGGLGLGWFVGSMLAAVQAAQAQATSYTRSQSTGNQLYRQSRTQAHATTCITGCLCLRCLYNWLPVLALPV